MYPQMYPIGFDENEQVIINPMGYTSLFYMEDLLHIKSLIETSIQTYEKLNISNERVDAINSKIIYTEDEKCSSMQYNSIEKKPYLYLFFDEAGNRLKIGRSHNPSKRILQIQWAGCMKLKSLFEIKDMGKEEPRVMSLFSCYRISGEWFSYQQEIVDYFETLKSNQGNEK